MTAREKATRSRDLCILRYIHVASLVSGRSDCREKTCVILLHHSEQQAARCGACVCYVNELLWSSVKRGLLNSMQDDSVELLEATTHCCVVELGQLTHSALVLLGHKSVV